MSSTSAGVKRFVTFRVSDDNPCDVCEIDSTPIDIQLAGVSNSDLLVNSAQFAANGIVVTSVRNTAADTVTPAVLKPADDSCEPRLITCKPLSNQTPSKFCEIIVKKAEAACDETFCAPCNPVQLVCDADPCHANEKCRALQRPAGTHLPCATLQVDSAGVRELLSNATNPPVRNVLIEKGCANQFGCEYGVAYIDAAGNTRFGVLVIDQEKNLKNADGSAPFNVDAFAVEASTSPVDIGCFDGQLYLLTTSPTQANNLLINMKRPTEKIEIPVGGPPLGGTPFSNVRNTAMTFDKRRNRILVGTGRGRVYAVDSDTFTLANAGNPLFNVGTVFMGDMKVQNDILVVISTGSISQNDNITVRNLVTDATTTDMMLLEARSFAAADIQPGIAAHPLCENVFYLLQTASDNNNGLILSCLTITDSYNAQFTVDEIDTIAGVVDVQATFADDMLQRLRPRYCDGVLQLMPSGMVNPAVEWRTLPLNNDPWQQIQPSGEFECNVSGDFSTMRIDNVCGPATLTFEWEISQSQPLSALAFFLNTSLEFSLTGPTLPTTETISLPAGFNLLEWTFATDPGVNTALVRDIRINGIPIAVPDAPNVPGALNPVLGPNPACPPARHLLTYCVSDNDPCNVERVANNVVPANVAPADSYPRHLITPDGCLLIAAASELRLAVPADCEQRYITKKLLTTQNPDTYCKTVVEKAEVACDETFCAPCNPMVAACEADPCGSLAERRVVQRPLGTHLPCATLQVDTVGVRELLAGAINAPVGDVLIEKGCTNQFGCEYGVAYTDNVAGGVRFGVLVIDQDKNLKNADGTLFDVDSFSTTTGFPYDIGCFDGELYLLTSELLIKMKSPTQTVSVASGLAMTFDKRRNRILIGAGTGFTAEVLAVDAVTFQLVTPSPLIAFADITFIGDLKAVGDSLFIVGTIDTVDDDRYIVVNLNDLTVPINMPSNGRRSFQLPDINAGISIHPTAPILYVAQTLRDNSAVSITCVKLDPDNPAFIQFENSNPVDQSKLLLLDGPIGRVQTLSSLARLRPRYCDGALQAFYPQVDETPAVWSAENDSWVYLGAFGWVAQGQMPDVLRLSNVCGPAELEFTSSGSMTLIINDVSETIVSGSYTRQLTLPKNNILWRYNGTSGDGTIGPITVNGIDVLSNLNEQASFGSTPPLPCPLTRLATACVDDNDPCNVQLVSNNALPATLLDASRATPQHVSAPDGCLLFAGTTTLTLAKPDACNPRLINKKPLSNQNPEDFCKLIVDKAEQACDASFCAPDNPFVTVFEQDCDPGKDCRAVTRPAGTHLPCATLQVTAPPVYDQTVIIADPVPDDVNVFALKPNPFGCEFVATWFVVNQTVGKLIRFVIDQDCQLRNATTGAIASTAADLGDVATVTGDPAGNNEFISHVICHDGVTYVAHRRGLTIEPFTADKRDVSLPELPLAVAVQSRNGHFAYVADRAAAIIRTVNLADGDAASSFNLETGGNANCRAVDVLVCGTFLLATLINYGPGPNDAVVLYDFSSNAATPLLRSTLVLTGQNSANGSLSGTTIWPGMVHHPTKEIVYVTGRKSNSSGADDLYLNAISYEQLSLQNKKTLTFTADPLSTPVTQKAIRPIYRDSVLQMVYPQSGNCALSTVRVNDSNPVDIETVQTVVLGVSPQFDACFERFASTPSGVLLLVSVQELGVFKPAPSAQRYLNDKPLLTQNPQDFCKLIVEEAETPQNANFCPPKNPQVVQCEPDPCQTMVKPRAVQKPAGTHFPCATLDLNATPLRERLSFFPGFVFGTQDDLNVFPGCPCNPNGCEYAAALRSQNASGTNARVSRFIVTDADGTVTSITGGALGIIDTGSQERITDMHCYRERMFALQSDYAAAGDNTTFRFLELGVNTVLSATTVSLLRPNGSAFTAFQTRAFAIQDDFVYIATYGSTESTVSVYTLDQITSGAVTNSPPLSAVLLPAGSTVNDIAACGKVLVIAYSDPAGPEDRLLVINISDPNNIIPGSSVGIPSSLSAQSADIISGLVQHPTANVVYLVNTRFPNSAGLNLNVIRFTQNAAVTPVIVKMFNNPVSINASLYASDLRIHAPLRLRPRYCDGALQTVYAAGATAPAKCYLDTYCVDDCDPTNVSLVSRQLLTDPEFDNCFPRHIATSTGRMILTGPAKISLYDAAPTTQRYLNKKPTLPSNVALLAFRNSGVDLFRSSGGTPTTLNNLDFLQFRPEVTFVSNFFGLSNPSLANNNLLTAPSGRKIMFHFDLTIILTGGTPPTLFVLSDDGNGTSIFKGFAGTLTQPTVYVVAINTQVIVSDTVPLQIQNATSSPLTINNGASDFSMQYLFDL